MTEDESLGASLSGGDAEDRSRAARLLGQSTSNAKAIAARENGKRGGRPKGIPASESTKIKISESKKMKKAETALEGKSEEIS